MNTLYTTPVPSQNVPQPFRDDDEITSKVNLKNLQHSHHGDPFNDKNTQIQHHTMLDAHSQLAASRELSATSGRTNWVNFGSGARPATSFTNQAFLGLFALIGASMALVTIWFFFLASNGGFKWRSQDWDDYKSTVLRRKGPDGRTLTNATKSTKLGGGTSVLGSFISTFTRSTKSSKFSATTDSSSSAHPKTYTHPYNDEATSVLASIAEKDHDLAEQGLASSHGKSRHHRRDSTLREYRHETSAGIGGLNQPASASRFSYPERPSKTRRTHRYEPLANSSPAASPEKSKETHVTDLPPHRIRKEPMHRWSTAADVRGNSSNSDSRQQKLSKSAPTIPSSPQSSYREPNRKSNKDPSKRTSKQLNMNHLPDSESYPNIRRYPERDHRSAMVEEKVPNDSARSDHRPASRRPEKPQCSTKFSENTKSYVDEYNRQRSRPNVTINHDSPPRETYRDDSDTGTKSYPCYIPGLSSSGGIQQTQESTGRRSMARKPSDNATKAPSSYANASSRPQRQHIRQVSHYTDDEIDSRVTRSHVHTDDSDDDSDGSNAMDNRSYGAHGKPPSAFTRSTAGKTYVSTRFADDIYPNDSVSQVAGNANARLRSTNNASMRTRPKNHRLHPLSGASLFAGKALHARTTTQHATSSPARKMPSIR